MKPAPLALATIGLVLGLGLIYSLGRSSDPGRVDTDRGPVGAPAEPARFTKAPMAGDLAAAGEAAASLGGSPGSTLTQVGAEDRRYAEVARRVDAYQAYVDGLMVEPPSALFDRWPEVVARGDLNELPAFLSAFAARLRAAGDDALYAALAATLYDPDATPGARKAVLTLFGQVATPQAVQALADFLLSDGRQDEIGEVLRDSLHEAAYGLFDGHPNWEVAPILTRTWVQLNAATLLADQAAVADGIANLGTAEGTRALFDTLRAPGSGDDQRRGIAADALGRLGRNEAVPVIQSVLADPGQDAETTWAGIAALVSINSADAYWVLMENLATPGIWDGPRLERLRETLAGQDISDEAVRVIEDTLERHAFQDPVVGGLLGEAVARRHSMQVIEAD